MALIAAILVTSRDVDTSHIEAARKRRRVDIKFRSMVREILWQLIMLVLFSWVVAGAVDSNVYYQNQDIRNTFIADTEVCRLDLRSRIISIVM